MTPKAEEGREKMFEALDTNRKILRVVLLDLPIIVALLGIIALLLG